MRLDASVGMLIDELEASGKADNTLIIYIGDHGAQFSRGKTSVYEAGLRIPMIVWWKDKIKHGISPKQLVSTIDIFPTILEAVGLKTGETLPGLSLFPLLKGENAPWRKYIFGQTNGSAPVLFFQQFSIRDERFKLIINPLRDRKNTCAEVYLTNRLSNPFFEAGCRPEEIKTAPEQIQKAYETYLNPPLYELYDLLNDPHEFKNLSGKAEYEKVQKRLLDDFHKWQIETNDPLANPDNLRKLTKEHDRLLNYNYRGDVNFRWGYLDYFKQ